MHYNHKIPFRIFCSFHEIELNKKLVIESEALEKDKVSLFVGNDQLPEYFI